LNLALVTWLNQVGYAAGLLLKSLGDKAEQWWYFLNDPSVPPNNNLAERSLRLAVTKWKVSGGSRSMKRFEETAAKIECDSNLSFSSSFSNGFFP
jgi:transposase